ncbi:uncharacterized protein A4U43_C09F13830 [Asparagus officinalis]|uniref:Uncharacterized protein n=1 Tax=Asparagus officinalis TaxID=4686 RepID=A0A5P1E7A7_ASPOF|nr:uncharacterized protein A4U43_C09F13830 [Asparagus officinalis]
MSADWGPVITAVVLFILLSPGLLFQLPAKTRIVEFGNMSTSGGSQCWSPPKSLELLGLRCFGRARDIRLDGADPNFVSQAFRGGGFPEGLQ